MRRPVVAIVAAGACCSCSAIPALSLHTADGALGQFPAGHETRVGFEAAAAAAGRARRRRSPSWSRARAGAVAIARNAAAVRDCARRSPATAASVPSRRRWPPPTAAPPDRGDAALDGEAPQAKALVQRLRDALPATAAARPRC